MSTLWKQTATHRPADNAPVYFRLPTKDVLQGWYADHPDWFWVAPGAPGGGNNPRIWPAHLVTRWRPAPGPDGTQWDTWLTGDKSDGTDYWLNPLYPSMDCLGGIWNAGIPAFVMDSGRIQLPESAFWAWTPQ